LETEFKTLADKVIKNKRLQNKKKIIIFSFCLLFSMSFWTLKKFSKEYQLIVPYNVSFQNHTATKVLLTNTDTTFYITIKSQGFNLIYYQLFNETKKINIDLSKIQLNNGENTNISYLGASQIIKAIKKQNTLDYNIVSIFPDTFALLWENAYIKNVAVKPILKLNFQKQYQLYDSIKIIPDSIYISGIHNDIKNIKFLYTEAFTINELNSNKSFYLNIIKPINKTKVKLFSDKVKIGIAVEKYTEAEIEVPINIQNNLQQSEIKIFPDKVKIKYLVALRDFKKINKEMFVAVANIQSNNKMDNKAKIDIVNFPLNVKISKIYPEKVEYIIFK
jgi:hypothetical protein